MRVTFVDFLQFLIQYIFFLLSAAVHESAHAWSAYKFGDPTAKLQNRISLNPANHIDIVGTVIIPFMVFLSGIPIIGWARPTPVNPGNFSNPKRDSMFVSGAGPVSNFLSVLLLAMLWHAAWAFTNRDNLIDPGETIPILFCYVFGMGIMVNLMLGVFNLLPIHPLDGSGVLEGLLPQPLLDLYAKMRPYGFIILLVLFYLTGLSRWIWVIITYFANFLGVGWFPLERIWNK
jgi:Zn-dependent protease